jgi:hypothetical protein
VRFNIGERVCRRTDVFDEKSRMRYGRVVMRYQRGGVDVYQVRWDDTNEVDDGYFEHGIRAAAENEGKKR